MTLREIQDFLNELDANGILYNATLTIIAKHCLRKRFGENVFEKAFDYIRSKILADPDFCGDSIPEKEEEFYRFIARELLGLREEPGRMLLQLFFESREDIKEISNRIDEMNNRIKEIENETTCRGRTASQDQRYEIEKLKYYIGKNTSARSEIENFLLNSIKRYALNECISFFDLIPRYCKSGPYLYSKRNMFSIRNNCDPKNYSITLIKFLKMPIRKFRNEVIPIDSDSAKIAEIGRRYIDENELVAQTRQLITTNHILHKRKIVLHKLLDLYTGREYLCFVYLAIPQVEGIFHDYCIEVGIKQDSIEIASLNEKLRLLKEKNHIDLLYEYFSFSFPMLRNSIAHGRLLETRIEDEATLLFLDLFPVCEMTTSEFLPINRSLSLIKSINDGSIDALYDWIEYYDLQIDPFYKMNEKILLVKEKYHKEEFWDMVSKKIETSFDVQLGELKNRINTLKKRGIEEDKCKALLKRIENAESQCSAA